MSTADKVRPLEEVSRIVASLKAEGKKVVQTHGVFDLLHIGHIRHFEQARQLGDVLVVTLTADQFVNKGPNRPAFPQSLRAEAIAALGMVDFVAINHAPLAVDAITCLRPNFYVKGQDYAVADDDRTGGIVHEEEAVRAVGGEIRFTDDITFSSSTLLNQFFSSLPPAVNDFLRDFRSHHSAGSIVDALDSFRALKVLVVGEAILDEYVYGDVIGKSGKEPILALRYDSKEIHAGGALAIANHLAQFCDTVDLITYLGETDSQEAFVRSQLAPNVQPSFIFKSDSPTIVKRRYVEQYLVQKLLEVYHINDEPLNEVEDAQLCAELRSRVADYDVVIVADYGHGLVSPAAIKVLSSRAAFLAVNTQINAANIGFHTISKFRRADYVCIHEGELRLDHRSRRGEIEPLINRMVDELGCQTAMVTRGKSGNLVFRQDQGFVECPAFAIKVVDRVGAGDAVLALTTLAAARGCPSDVIGFLGNVVGAQAVTIVGNARSIDRIALIRTIETLLK
ncbi:MAG: PfkB family carbohydrate kinase [Dehalococcoidia bacterium]